MNKFKEWWRIQKAHFTAWKIHEKIGTMIGVPIMFIACSIGLWKASVVIPWYVFFPVVVFAFFVGVLVGYEVCQNHLETGKKAIILWLKERVVDSFMDVVVASWKSGIISIIIIAGYYCYIIFSN